MGPMSTTIRPTVPEIALAINVETASHDRTGARWADITDALRRLNDQRGTRSPAESIPWAGVDSGAWLDGPGDDTGNAALLYDDTQECYQLLEVHAFLLGVPVGWPGLPQTVRDDLLGAEGETMADIVETRRTLGNAVLRLIRYAGDDGTLCYEVR